VEQKGRQRLTQVPFDMVGEHAQKNMRANTVGAPVPNRADFQIHSLHRTEGAFYSREVFVCLYRIRGAEFGCRHAGADDIDDIDTVELGFSGD
jgi:hypothetical protein